MNDAAAKSTRVDTIQRGNERAIARVGGTISAGILITNSLIKILNPHAEFGRPPEPLAVSPELAGNIQEKGWA